MALLLGSTRAPGDVNGRVCRRGYELCGLADNDGVTDNNNNNNNNNNPYAQGAHAAAVVLVYSARVLTELVSVKRFLRLECHMAI